MLFSVLVYFALKQITKRRYSMENSEQEAVWSGYVMIASAVAMVCNLCNGPSSIQSIPFYLSMTLAGLYPLSSSVVPGPWSKVTAIVLAVLQILFAVLAVLLRYFMEYRFGHDLYHYLARSACCLSALLFIFSVYHKVRDVKSVMKAGSVWTVVCTYVDAVYVMLLMLVSLVLPVLNIYVMISVMALLVVALAVRLMNSSLFVIFTRHERRIIESMKVSQAEFAGESPGTASLYSNIYERLLDYFEKHKPYLDSELTINDIVDVVFTNKLYISKAISHCTGRNFCQFVNYYRITHAVKLFRGNPQMKVVELAGKSGFNSTTSFSTAFRLYMGESPGDWCRKERVRLSKK